MCKFTAIPPSPVLLQYGNSPWPTLDDKLDFILQCNDPRYPEIEAGIQYGMLPNFTDPAVYSTKKFIQHRLADRVWRFVVGEWDSTCLTQQHATMAPLSELITAGFESMSEKASLRYAIAAWAEVTENKHDNHFSLLHAEKLANSAFKQMAVEQQIPEESSLKGSVVSRLKKMQGSITMKASKTTAGVATSDVRHTVDDPEPLRRWQVLLDGVWTAYPPDVNAALNQALAAGQTVYDWKYSKKNKYTLDMHNLVQTNVGWQTKRAMRMWTATDAQLQESQRGIHSQDRGAPLSKAATGSGASSSGSQQPGAVVSQPISGKEPPPQAPKDRGISTITITHPKPPVIAKAPTMRTGVGIAPPPCLDPTIPSRYSRGRYNAPVVQSQGSRERSRTQPAGAPPASWGDQDWGSAYVGVSPKGTSWGRQYTPMHTGNVSHSARARSEHRNFAQGSVGSGDSVNVNVPMPPPAPPPPRRTSTSRDNFDYVDLHVVSHEQTSSGEPLVLLGVGPKARSRSPPPSRNKIPKEPPVLKATSKPVHAEKPPPQHQQPTKDPAQKKFDQTCKDVTRWSRYGLNAVIDFPINYYSSNKGSYSIPADNFRIQPETDWSLPDGSVVNIQSVSTNPKLADQLHRQLEEEIAGLAQMSIFQIYPEPDGPQVGNVQYFKEPVEPHEQVELSKEEKAALKNRLHGGDMADPDKPTQLIQSLIDRRHGQSWNAPKTGVVCCSAGKITSVPTEVDTSRWGAQYLRNRMPTDQEDTNSQQWDNWINDVGLVSVLIPQAKFAIRKKIEAYATGNTRFVAAMVDHCDKHGHSRTEQPFVTDPNAPDDAVSSSDDDTGVPGQVMGGQRAQAAQHRRALRRSEDVDKVIARMQHGPQLHVELGSSNNDIKAEQDRPLEIRNVTTPFQHTVGEFNLNTVPNASVTYAGANIDSAAVAKIKQEGDYIPGTRPAPDVSLPQQLMRLCLEEIQQYTAVNKLPTYKELEAAVQWNDRKWRPLFVKYGTVRKVLWLYPDQFKLMRDTVALTNVDEREQASKGIHAFERKVLATEGGATLA